MSEVYISKKSFYDTPLGDDKAVVPEMRRDCYAVFACRHKFCRDVCPVYFETRDETTGSYGLHTSILGMAEGHVHCRICKTRLRCAWSAVPASFAAPIHFIPEIFMVSRQLWSTWFARSGATSSPKELRRPIGTPYRNISTRTLRKKMDQAMRW